MEVQKCYYASFNVGAFEVWGTELYRDKNSVITEMENSLEDILEAIGNFSLLDETEIVGFLTRALVELKETGFFRENDNQFDFFILEQPIWENYEQKKKIENGIN